MSRGEARLARPSRNRGGARHPLVELTLTRLREFIREPEALFWAFVFPILMSVAMAVAFPSRGARPVIVGVEDTPRAAAVRGALSSADGVTMRTLAPGDQGNDVKELQLFLTSLNLFPTTIIANGYYGPTTTGSVRKFQQSNNILQTGTFGPLTRRAANIIQLTRAIRQLEEYLAKLAE